MTDSISYNYFITALYNKGGHIGGLEPKKGKHLRAPLATTKIPYNQPKRKSVKKSLDIIMFISQRFFPLSRRYNEQC